jgi:hypothetical protein
VFVQHSLHIERSIGVVTSALISGPRKWFPRINGDGSGAVGPSVAGVGFRKKVRVSIGEPVTGGSWTEVPVAWQATTIMKMFPVMTGKVEVAPVDAGVTRLTVSGMYSPPLGRLGKHLDDALMHRVAEGTVRELAESIAKRLDGASSARDSGSNKVPRP